MDQTIKVDTTLISYCGLYCGACKKYIKGDCPGCKDKAKETPSWCKVKPCNEEKAIANCSHCEDFTDLKKCSKMYPLSYKFGEFITGFSRELGISIIGEEGEEEFAQFMAEHNKSLCVKKRIYKKHFK